MLVSQAKGKQVVSTSSAETVGKVDDVVVDAPAQKVIALHLKKTSVEGDTLPWACIRGFGDAVTVDEASAVGEASDEVREQASKQLSLHGKRVLTDKGEELGDVKDLDFDPSTGEVLELVLGKKQGTVAGSRLLAAGSYAVVVSA